MTPAYDRCERCGTAGETDLDLSCFRYLGTCCLPAPGVCADCRATIEACGCERGCLKCGRSAGPRQPVEVEG